MKKGNVKRQVMTMYEAKLGDKQHLKEKTHVVTTYTVTLPPHYISIVLLTPINYTRNMQTNTLLDIEANPFFLIEQPNVTVIPALQKLESRAPDKFMAILWNPGGQSTNIKKNITIGYIKELEYIKNPKLTKRKISGKFPKYLKKNYYLCLRNQHLHFITTSILNQK